jgi:hypothetical protein
MASSSSPTRLVQTEDDVLLGFVDGLLGASDVVEHFVHLLFGAMHLHENLVDVVLGANDVPIRFVVRVFAFVAQLPRLMHLLLALVDVVFAESHGVFRLVDHTDDLEGVVMPEYHLVYDANHVVFGEKDRPEYFNAMRSSLHAGSVHHASAAARQPVVSFGSSTTAQRQSLAAFNESMQEYSQSPSASLHGSPFGPGVVRASVQIVLRVDSLHASSAVRHGFGGGGGCRLGAELRALFVARGIEPHGGQPYAIFRIVAA